MVIVTVDLGTTITKVDVWDESGRLGSGRAELVTTRPAPDRAEQDPQTWWPALRSACAAARRAAPEAWAEVGAIGFAAARQTIVVVGADGVPRRPALLWSDRRAGAQARTLTGALGGDAEVRRRTGQVVRATSVAAKLAWLDADQPELRPEARWVVTPRDWVVGQLTGRTVTDPTMASAGWPPRPPRRGDRRTGRALGGSPGTGGPVGHRGGRRATRARPRTGPAQRYAGGDRGRRPGLRGAGHRRHPGRAHGVVGDGGQRVPAGVVTRRRGPSRAGGHPNRRPGRPGSGRHHDGGNLARRGWLAGGGWAVGSRLAAGLGGRAHRPVRRRAGRRRPGANRPVPAAWSSCPGWTAPAPPGGATTPS